MKGCGAFKKQRVVARGNRDNSLCSIIASFCLSPIWARYHRQSARLLREGMCHNAASGAT